MTGEPAPVRAVVFDVDGTLYRQPPLRRRMALELVLAAALRPRRTARTIRILRSFRGAREDLRALGRPDEPLEALQHAVPAERLGVGESEVRAVVDEWIHRRPLRHLRAHRRPGLEAALDRLRELGLRLAVFSDYPAEAKLAALGIAGRFDAVLAATDPEVNAFKPHPAGFLAATRRLGVAPPEALYVGDRDDVDGRGARAAGLRAALVGSGPDAAPTLGDLLARHGWS